MVPMPQQPPQPIVSSSSTLWAQASKEWVIPAKPKPGRKPKKESAPPPTESDEVDSKGRRIQNRAAQRAFRERKQSQLADLQARVQLYEQGEIERNVALQNVAKRLKDENELLRQENSALKDEISRMRKDRESGRDGDRKRWRDDGIPLNPANLFESSARKRRRTGTESPAPGSHFSQSINYFPSSPSIASSPESNAGSNHAYSPLPYPPPSRAQSVFSSQGPPSSAYVTSLKQFEGNASFGAFDCGLCDDNTPCVCREMALQDVLASQKQLIGGIDQNNTITPHAPSGPRLSSSPAPISILDNLPAYQPPVPLRRNGPSNPLAAPIFQIMLPSPDKEAICTGDPSNCPACVDDVFGKAFCSAIGDAVCSDARCASCPRRSTAPSLKQTTAPIETFTTISLTSADEDVTPTQTQAPPEDEPETIPCSEAWRQLKSHPNIGFADLAMLADVVARRTKCSGPRVVISPEPGSTTPERLAMINTSPNNREDDQPILLVDPHARYHQLSGMSAPPSPPVSLVPQDVLQECGQARVREVDAAGVREALRLLDAQFGRP